jgi:hypothetical protein
MFAKMHRSVSVGNISTLPRRSPPRVIAGPCDVICHSQTPPPKSRCHSAHQAGLAASIHSWDMLVSVRLWLCAQLARCAQGSEVLDIDIEHCPNCGAALKIIAAIEDPPVIAKILTHLGLPTRGPPRAPARRVDLFQTI